MEFEGIVEDIIFRNEENGYTVFILDTSDGPITVVGSIPFIRKEETVKVLGDLVFHDNYGEQVEAREISLSRPSSLSSIENYLSSGILPNIGPKTARNIVGKFKEETFYILDNQPERLLEIRGIGEKKLGQIMEAYREQEGLRFTLMEFQKYNISNNLALKIYKVYKEDSLKILRENPYRISEDVYGVGFRKADQIALSMGLEKNSPNRIISSFSYILKEALKDGDTYLEEDILLRRAEKLLDIKFDEIKSSLDWLKKSGESFIVSFNKGGKELIYLDSIHKSENRVARRILDLVYQDLEDHDLNLDRELEKIEKEMAIDFADKQKLAIKEALKNGLTVITGGPGTGKTTIIKGIISLAERLDLEVDLGAPTGRAAKRMTEATGKEAKTIHRLLEYSPLEGLDQMAFGRDRDNPLPGDIVIIDEVSMIDLSLMDSLLRAIGDGTRLVLVGDVDQLPSVGPGKILKDIISSEIVKVVGLNEIFRQAEDSYIIVNAHRINEGKYPILNEKDKDFYFFKARDEREILLTIVDLASRRLGDFYDLDSIRDIQVLSPMRKSLTGVDILNKELQKALNPPARDKEEIEIGDNIFREGDKVMQMKNNYNVSWKTYKMGLEVESGQGIFNGDLGFITSIDQDLGQLKILIDSEKEVVYNFKDLDQISLAYATTIHKAQGSEFPVIVMPIRYKIPILNNRNLLYTGITRGRQLVVLVGDEYSLEKMIRNDKVYDRRSSLDYKMKQVLPLYEGIEYD